MSGRHKWWVLGNHSIRTVNRPARTGTTEGKCQEIPDIVEFTRQRLGFDPNPLQELVLRGGRRGIVNCTRQWGKSTVAAAKAVHRAYCQPDSLILVLSPSARQSGEFVRKAEEFVSRLGIKARGDGANEISIAFPNRSRIVGLPHNEATLRGFSEVSMMLIDEAARVEDKLYRAMRPTLAVGNGDLWLMSTPNGKRDSFMRSGRKGASSGNGSARQRRNARGSTNSFWTMSGRV
jgi:hypothetical protein